MAAPVLAVHVWEPGDEWWDLAEKYTGNGANWVALAWFNDHIKNPNNVPQGTRVHLPGELMK